MTAAAFARLALKRVAEGALLGSGAAALYRRRMAGRVLVLAYHNVVPDDLWPTGDVANHLPLSRFLSEMAELRETHDVVDIGDALGEGFGSFGRPRAVVTFDDAYRGAVCLAIPALVSLGMPATLFIAPGCLGGQTFWWDALANTTLLDPAVRSYALETLRGDCTAIVAWAKQAGLPLRAATPMAQSCTIDEVVHASTLPGITLGSHTWSHPNLTRLPASELAAELTRPISWLREHVRNPASVLAYPYGAFDPSVIRAAAAAGYGNAFAVSGGWLPEAAHEPLALPRLNIPSGLTTSGFQLRLAGLLAH